MDKVRFGRALGYGARHAAKAIKNAAEAAAAGPVSAAQSRSAPPPPTASAAPYAAHTQSSPVTTSTQRQTTRLKSRSFFSPLRQFSSTVMLQVMGTMFALFAAFMGQGVWRLRGSFAGGPHNTPEAHRLYLELGMCLLFSYFTVSSFVRAARR